MCFQVLLKNLSLWQQWDCIEIEEETEDNKKVKSTIRVPMQVSDLYSFVVMCRAIEFG